MKYLFILLMIWGLGMTGCRTVAPVSHSLEKEEKRDSLSSKKESIKDSTITTEKVTEKILPEATAGVTLTTNKTDSLSHALGKLPKGAKLIYQDPKLRAQLKIYKDSLNQVHIECTATEQKYWEKEKAQTRFIEKLVSELTKVSHEKEVLEKTVLQQKTPWWQKLKHALIGILILFVLLLAAVLYGLKKMRLR